MRIMENRKSAVIIGNSDGIGLALTKRLLDLGWTVWGLSRSDSEVRHDSYSHARIDVTSRDYAGVLGRAASGGIDACVYCAGIGQMLDLADLSADRAVFEVNLTGALRTLEVVLPGMVMRRSGHCLVLSSIADELVMPEAPSYAASKAGLSAYVEGLAPALRDRGVAITNVRFGFVDTKMAKGDRKPFLMTVEKAVDHLLYCLEKRPVRFTRPRRMGLLAAIVGRWRRMIMR